MTSMSFETSHNEALLAHNNQVGNEGCRNICRSFYHVEFTIDVSVIFFGREGRVHISRKGCHSTGKVNTKMLGFVDNLIRTVVLIPNLRL